MNGLKTHGLMLLAGLALPFRTPAVQNLAVTFDAALTNGTDWTYDDGVQIFKETGNAYFRTLNSSVASPSFDAVVTSVRLRAACTHATPTRQLYVRPVVREEIRDDLAHMFDTNGLISKASEQRTFVWDEGDAVTGFVLTMKGSASSGNWHIYSAEVTFGAPAPPRGLTNVVVSGNAFSAGWINPAGTCSNAFHLGKPGMCPEAGVQIAGFDFAAVTNAGGNPKQITGPPMLSPGFDGTRLYAPTGSVGVLQIGTGSDSGRLVFSGTDDYADVTLLLSLRRKDSGNLVPLAWVRNDVTNELVTLEAGLEFERHEIPLDDVPGGAEIVLHSATNRASGRIFVDEFRFVRNYAPAHPVAEPVFDTVVRGPPYSVRGLEKSTDYVWWVEAFDAEGGRSAVSVSRGVRTLDFNDALGTLLKLR